MTDIATPPVIKRMVGCRACGRPTGEFVAPNEKPLKSYCDDCYDLPLPWRVTYDEDNNRITTWNPDRRQHTDNDYALSPNDMWAEPTPERPAGVRRNAFTANLQDLQDVAEAVEVDDDDEDFIEDPVPPTDRPRCVCGGHVFTARVPAQGELRWTIYADEPTGENGVYLNFNGGVVKAEEYVVPVVRCNSCDAEYDGMNVETPDREYRVRQ